MNLYNLTNFHPSKEHVPLHVGLIPDGTGRWATINNIDTMGAYKYSTKKVTEFLDFFFERGTVVASIYMSSIQNFRRSKESIEAFCQGQEHFVSIELPNFLNKFQASVIAVGDIDVLPQQFRNSLLKIQKSTSKFKHRKIYLCTAYNPLTEILSAVSSSADKGYVRRLWVKEPLDLVIRTSGANLLSNFLPLQSGYARLYWIEKLFPDVDVQDYEFIYNEFVKLERKYGD